MAKCYISGPITGIKNYQDAFIQCEMELVRQGHIAINPAMFPEGLEPKDYMRMSIAMLESADTLVLLPGWQNSKGVKIEKLYAECIGLRVLEWEAI